MKTMKAVIGSHFGDEGKGLMTDYFCAATKKNLNIRFNGGSQAGHTVTEKTGSRHVFHHFGAGSMNPDTATFLSPYFIINPIDFFRERQSLAGIGIYPLVYVAPACKIVLPYDIFINRLLEQKRSGGRHGSCGAGVYECILRSASNNAVCISDVMERTDLPGYLRAIRDGYCLSRLESLGIALDSSGEYGEMWRSDRLLHNFIGDLQAFISLVSICNDPAALVACYENIIFEGAQGLLLDRDNTPFMPHLTPTNTGLKNVCHMLRQWDTTFDLEVCYVTRPYLTRHGAGRLDTETPKAMLRHRVSDDTNQANKWQGDLRFGYFDPLLFEQAILKDLSYLEMLSPANKSIALAVTHLDTTAGSIITEECDIPVCCFSRQSGIPWDHLYAVYGRCREDVNKISFS